MSEGAQVVQTAFAGCVEFGVQAIGSPRLATHIADFPDIDSGTASACVSKRVWRVLNAPLPDPHWR